MTIPIIGIDPGSNQGGCAVMEVYVNKPGLPIKSIVTYPLDMRHTKLSPIYDALTARLINMSNILRRIFDYHNPASVTIEHGFINRFRPGAFGPLSKTIGAIQMTAYKHNNFLPVFLLSPIEVKQAVNVKQFQGKNPVLLAMSAVAEISDKLDLSLRTEHEIDAVAIAYGQLRKYRTGGILQLCLI